MDNMISTNVDTTIDESIVTADNKSSPINLDCNSNIISTDTDVTIDESIVTADNKSSPINLDHNSNIISTDSDSVSIVAADNKNSISSSVSPTTQSKKSR